MKRFFRGPVKRLVVTNIELLNNSCVCNKHIEIVKKRELFYENFFGTMIRKKDRMPMILENELEDMINFYGENGTKCFSTEFINISELSQIKVSKIKNLIKK